MFIYKYTSQCKNLDILKTEHIVVCVVVKAVIPIRETNKLFSNNQYHMFSSCEAVISDTL